MSATAATTPASACPWAPTRPTTTPGLEFSDEGVQVQVTDETFAPYFERMPQAGYTPAFVEENELKVTVPIWTTRRCAWPSKSHPMWKEFDGRCISCGACTVACSTCTCFTTRDVIYGDNPAGMGERRVTASCQIACAKKVRSWCW